MPNSHVSKAAGRPVWPTLLCWLTVLLEGFDLVVLGAVIPTLVKSKHVGMTDGGATTVATLSLVGVAIGAALVGPLTDRIGRRQVLVGSVVLFSVFTIIIPLMPSVATFAGARLLAGLGLGACMPTALTFMAEHMPVERRSHSSTFTMTGYHVGAVLAALLALVLVPDWQPLFVFAGIAGFALAPVMWWKLPESQEFLEAKERGETERVTLFGAELGRINAGVWVGCFMGLLLVYGLNTWLPQLMRKAGYGMSSSITMLFVLNAGAVIGLLLAGRLADRKGVKPMILIWFAAAAVLLAILSIKMTSTVALNAVIFVTGVFVFSAQVLIYAYIAHAYPAAIRGTALGTASAVGRLGAIVGPFITGTLVSTGHAHPWGFYFFAVVAALGLMAVAVVPHEREVERRREEIVHG